jgi:uncharacterized Zn-binding protein involved in type VI secretion
MVNPGPVPHVGGPIIKGAATVFIGKMLAARIGDVATCAGPPDVIVKGSATVMIEKLPAARMGDNTAHGGVIATGFPLVNIGDAPGVVAVSGAAGGGAVSVTGVSVNIGASSQQGQALTRASEDGRPFCEL